MKYPSYIPQKIIDNYLERMSTLSKIARTKDAAIQKIYDEHAKKTTEIYERLLNSKEMEPVWKSLIKRSRSKNFGEITFLLSGILDIKNIGSGYPSSRTISEQKQQFDKAIKLSGMLSDKILTVALGPFSKHGQSRPSDLIVKDLTKLGFNTTIPTALKNLQEFLMHCKEELKAPIGKPKAKNAPRTLFITLLSNYIRDIFGTPLHKNVATVTNVLFSSNIDVTHVRNTIKNNPIEGCYLEDLQELRQISLSIDALEDRHN